MPRRRELFERHSHCMKNNSLSQLTLTAPPKEEPGRRPPRFTRCPFGTFRAPRSSALQGVPRPPYPPPYPRLPPNVNWGFWKRAVEGTDPGRPRAPSEMGGEQGGLGGGAQRREGWETHQECRRQPTPLAQRGNSLLNNIPCCNTLVCF